MTELLQIGCFTIDLAAFELRRDGDPVAVESLVLDLIIELARHLNALCTRGDLIEAVWNGRIVSDTTISTAIKSARKALGDTGADQKLIGTVRGRGFQFIGDVSGGPSGAGSEASAIPVFPTLYIRVAALDDTFSEALTRQLENGLRTVSGRIPFLHIKAPLTKSLVSHDAALGSTHVMQVVLSSITQSIHADASLTETCTDIQKWARHFSARTDDRVESLLADIGAKAEPQILREMASYLAARGRNEPRALVLEAIHTIAARGWNPVSITAASEMLCLAIDQDDTLAFAFAYAILSLMQAIVVWQSGGRFSRWPN